MLDAHYSSAVQVRVTAAQSQDDGLVALPKQFYLGFASSLGITKDITRTQAYSVWLQGNASHSADDHPPLPLFLAPLPTMQDSLRDCLSACSQI